MTNWEPGAACRVVEHDNATRQPKPGGKVHPGEVIAVNGAYVTINYDDETVTGGKPDQFYADSGWRAWDGIFRWRLDPRSE